MRESNGTVLDPHTLTGQGKKVKRERKKTPRRCAQTQLRGQSCDSDPTPRPAPD